MHRSGDEAASPLRVLVVDSRRDARASVRRHLEGGGVIVCAEASTAAEARTAALDKRPDLCLLADTGERRWLAIAETLAEAAPTVRVVLRGPAPGDDDLLDAVRAGALGYLDDAPGPRLVPALYDVLAGRPAFPARLNTLLFARLRASRPPRPAVD